MKKLLAGFCALLMFLAVVNIAQANNISIDGSFDETVEWAGHYFDDDGVGNNGYVGPGYGGQAYDLEYMGLYEDGGTLYFGLQSGFDLVDGEPVYGYDPGTFGLDVDGDGNYEYAIDYSVVGNDVTYDLYDTTTGGIWLDPAVPAHIGSTPWKYDPQGQSSILQWTETGGYGEHMDLANNSDGGKSYVLEGSIGLSELALWNGGEIELHYTMECGNDVANQTEEPTPEPATVALLGMGMAGLVGMGLRKRRKDKKRAEIV